MLAELEPDAPTSTYGSPTLECLGDGRDVRCIVRLRHYVHHEGVVSAVDVAVHRDSSDVESGAQSTAEGAARKQVVHRPAPCGVRVHRRPSSGVAAFAGKQE